MQQRRHSRGSTQNEARHVHLVSEVVHSQDRAGVLVDPMRAVLGSQEDWHQGPMPVIGNEDAVIPKEALVKFQDEWCLQGRYIQESKAELHQQIHK